MAKAVKHTVVTTVVLGSVLCVMFIMFPDKDDTKNTEPASSYTIDDSHDNDENIPLEKVVAEVAEEEASIDVNSQSEGPSPIPVQSDLASFAGFGHNSAEDTRVWKKDEERRQAAIKTCMQQQGYEYTIDLPTYISADDDVSVSDVQAIMAQETTNDQYVNSLGDLERVAYYLALYGVEDPNSESELDQNQEQGSCFGDALRDIPGVYAIASSLHDVYAEVDNAVWDDPISKAVESDWSKCMFDAGHSFESHPDMFAHIGERTSEYLVQVDQQLVVDPAVATEVALIESDSENCNSAISYHERLQTVRARHENEFVEQYREVLEGTVVRTPPSKNAF